ncbi:hypothetical protein [Rhizobium sp. Leaf383]|uniref:hypothetical protein n=1 Tax=Rhizobium sp. Leaf383 TaxID=1736357 RepID=UPI0012E3BC6C|nr:hypothetical protein [Rhizobium sp. Leaf383]
MSRVYAHKHTDIVVQGAVIDLAVGHYPAAECAAAALRALHPGLRIGAILRDRGMLWLDVGYETAVYPDDIYDRVLEIVTDARTLSAWSCAVDGRPGWLVNGAGGPVVLCPVCQTAAGMEVRRHEA